MVVPVDRRTIAPTVRSVSGAGLGPDRLHDGRNSFPVFRVEPGPRHSPDPMGGDITNPQSLNRYAYVLNDATSLTDPLGLQGCTNLLPGGSGWCREKPEVFYMASWLERMRLFDLIMNTECDGENCITSPNQEGMSYVVRGDYYLQEVGDCSVEGSGWRKTDYQLMNGGNRSNDYYIQEQVSESWSPTFYDDLIGSQPTVTGAQGSSKGVYDDRISAYPAVGGWRAPRTLLQTFYISTTPTTSKSLAPNSTPVPIHAPLANGGTGVLPAQTIVKTGGRVLSRGTLAPGPCSGKEYD